MNINLKFLLLGTSLSLIPNFLYAQCSPAQNCAELGYKETSNKGGCLKCPFGNGWYCPDSKEEKAVLGECTGYAKNCKVGNILNSDGTCANDKVNGKTPIGVVIAVKDDCGWAITANPVAQGTPWSTKPNYAVLPVNSGNITNVYDNCEYTKILTAKGNNSEFPAAWVAINYAPTAAPETKGKWCLPSPGIMKDLFPYLNEVNNAIAKLSGTVLTAQIGPESYVDRNEHLWLSVEGDNLNAYYFCAACPTFISDTTKKNYLTTFTVRPVLAF